MVPRAACDHVTHSLGSGAVVDHPAKGREKTESTVADGPGSRSADAVDVNSFVRSIFEELPHGISTTRR